MFIFRFFTYAFKPSLLFSRLKENMVKYLIYFLVMVLISVFPMNYLIIKERTFRINFISQDFQKEEPIWDLPEDFAIIGNAFIYLGEDKSYQVVETHKNVQYVFNHSGKDIDHDKEQFLFTKNNIIYVDGKGSTLSSDGYKGFPVESYFSEMNGTQGTEERTFMYRAFGAAIENSFSNYIVFYAILINVGQSILINILYIFLLSLVIQLFRFGYSKFMTYQEAIKFLILAMGIPSVLALIFGVIAPGFGPVVFQLGMGMMVMLVMLIFGKKYYS